MNMNTTTYKGITIEEFPLEWHYDNQTWNTISYIIHSPYTLEHGTPLPLYCENEYGEHLEFKTINEAEEYIDNYIVAKKVKLMVKHGDEITAVVKDEFRKEKEEDE